MPHKNQEVLRDLLHKTGYLAWQKRQQLYDILAYGTGTKSVAVVHSCVWVRDYWVCLTDGKYFVGKTEHAHISHDH